MTDSIHPDAGRWGGWSWSEPSHGEHFRRCSYCGSVHPADLAAEPTWRAQWADRKYGWPHKFYVDIPNRDPGALFAVGLTSGGPTDRPLDPGWIAWENLTDEQRGIVERDRLVGDRPPRGVLFGTRPSHFGKFYTIHLSDPEIPDEIKGAIQSRSGLYFEFTDGHVGWKSAP